MAIREQTIVGSTCNALSALDRQIAIVGKIEEPLILILEQVLSSDECDALINQAKLRLQRAKIGPAHSVSDIRTGSSMFFEESEDESIRTIEARLSELMNVPIAHAEPLQILHYRAGDQYRPHVDYFTSGQVINNRISTMVIYLNDVKEGGETVFPLLGLAVTPRKGNAVYFEYLYNDKSINERTLHAGSPVRSGEKWVATQWMRRQSYR